MSSYVEGAERSSVGGESSVEVLEVRGREDSTGSLGGGGGAGEGEGSDLPMNVPNKRKPIIINKKAKASFKQLHKIKTRKRRNSAEARRAMYKFPKDLNSISLIFRQPLKFTPPPNNVQDLNNLNERELCDRVFELGSSSRPNLEENLGDNSGEGREGAETILEEREETGDLARERGDTISDNFGEGERREDMTGNFEGKGVKTLFDYSGEEEGRDRNVPNERKRMITDQNDQVNIEELRQIKKRKVLYNEEDMDCISQGFHQHPNLSREDLYGREWYEGGCSSSPNISSR